MDGDKLQQLLGDLCNDALSSEDGEKLAALLESDPAAREAYNDYVDVHLSLVDNAVSGHDTPIDEVPAYEPLHTPAASSRSRWRLTTAACIGLAASLLVGLGFGLLLRNTQSGPELLASAAAPGTSLDSPVKDGFAAPSAAAFFVAQVKEVSPDIVWDGPAADDFLLRLSRGNRIDLAQGSLQIDYFAGASLVLQGPCSFVVTGESSGRLHSGNMTGNVTEGQFLLTTPTAWVLDLGTEFGVSVSEDNQTDVCVFDGEVEVSAELGSPGVSSPIRLRRGAAASVARGGRIVEVTNPDETRYLRQVPENRLLGGGATSQVSLADVLAANYDASINLAAVIAPDSGLPDRQPWLRPDGPGYSSTPGYHRSSWHRFVDGVFIPPQSGGMTQVHTLGAHATMPASTGRTWGPIWARVKTQAPLPSRGGEDYWGTDTLGVVVERFAECQSGMIGLHSNVGITFDLQAIAEACQGRLNKLSGRVCNLDNSMNRFPNWAGDKRFSADLRVFVDGKLRESVLSFDGDDGEIEFSADLRKGDRFLTVVTTDDGERDELGESLTTFADAYDHVVLIDPLLTLTN